jgi:hypothetical protein
MHLVGPLHLQVVLRACAPSLPARVSALAVRVTTRVASESAAGSLSSVCCWQGIRRAQCAPSKGALCARGACSIQAGLFRCILLSHGGTRAAFHSRIILRCFERFILGYRAVSSVSFSDIALFRAWALGFLRHGSLSRPCLARWQPRHPYAPNPQALISRHTDAAAFPGKLDDLCRLNLTSMEWETIDGDLRGYPPAAARFAGVASDDRRSLPLQSCCAGSRCISRA